MLVSFKEAVVIEETYAKMSKVMWWGTDLFVTEFPDMKYERWQIWFIHDGFADRIGKKVDLLHEGCIVLFENEIACCTCAVALERKPGYRS